MQKQAQTQLCRLNCRKQKKMLRAMIVAAMFLCTTVFADPAQKLSLSDAIFLAVRSNPNVEVSQLNHVLQKYNVQTQEWEFKPHFALKTSATYGRSRIAPDPFVINQGVNVEPTASWLSPVGTQVNFLASNQETDHFNPGLSLQVMQPLLQGFGKPVVEAALNNARDSLTISQMNVENVLRTTVTDVINAYLDVLMAESVITIDQDALERAQKSIKQTEEFIKAGHMAGNEIVTVKAEAANAKTALENDKNQLWEKRNALLTAIGLDPNSNIQFDKLNIGNLIAKYELPTLDVAKTAILQNDMQYKIDEITLHGPTSRNLLVAEDNTRWRLNLEATGNTGNGLGGGKNSGFASLFNGENQGQSVGLTLQIPFDDQAAKQGLVAAKIALQEAEIALKKERWQKETDAMNGWHLVVADENSLRFAIDAEKLQEKTYNISYQKYLHGLIDSLELQAAQQQLLQSQQQLLNARISYLKALVNLDLLMGKTLKTWNIQSRLT